MAEHEKSRLNLGVWLILSDFKAVRASAEYLTNVGLVEAVSAYPLARHPAPLWQPI